MRIIAVLNQKGGVGKTTTVANTAAALAASGKKVVSSDLDPQAHLTIHLGIEPQNIISGSYRILTQSAKFETEIMMVRPNLWLLPANIDLVGAESELVSVVGRETILREAIEASEEHFDYCMIDCAPSLGLLTLNALAAAEEVLIPLQPHFLALQGFGKLLQTIELVNRRINPNLKVKGILLCMYDSRASLPKEVKNDIENFLRNARGTNSAWAEAQVLPTFIRRNIKLAEAPSYGKTIFEYEPNCNGAQDYQKVAEYILGKPAEPEQLESLELTETTETQENLEQPEYETLQPYPIQEEYSEPAEPTPQEEFQNQQQSPEHTESTETNDSSDNFIQPEPPAPEQQGDYTSDTEKKPPFEIREIPPADSQEYEQYTPTSQEQNQPENQDQGNEHEHRDY
jgi:chromosome partitioning protein